MGSSLRERCPEELGLGAYITWLRTSLSLFLEQSRSRVTAWPSGGHWDSLSYYFPALVSLDLGGGEGVAVPPIHRTELRWECGIWGGVSQSACASGTGNIKRRRGRKRKRTTLSQFWKSHLGTNNRAQSLELNQLTLQKKPWSKHHALSPCFVFLFLLEPLQGGSHRISPDIPLAPSLTSFCLPWPSSSNCNPLNSVSSFSVSFHHNAQPSAT